MALLSDEKKRQIEKEILGVSIPAFTEYARKLKDIPIGEFKNSKELENKQNISGILSTLRRSRISWNTETEMTEDEYSQLVKNFFYSTKEFFDWEICKDTAWLAKIVPSSSDPSTPTPPTIEEIFDCLIKLHRKKSRTYGDSWIKRGELGAFMNIARKFDRAENIVLSNVHGVNYCYDMAPKGEESLIDQLLDLALYACKLATRDEKEFEDWRKRNGI